VLFIMVAFFLTSTHCPLRPRCIVSIHSQSSDFPSHNNCSLPCLLSSTCMMHTFIYFLNSLNSKFITKLDFTCSFCLFTVKGWLRIKGGHDNKSRPFNVCCANIIMFALASAAFLSLLLK